MYTTLESSQPEIAYRFLECADRAILMQKEKRTDNNATLDIVGRDQPDQKIHLIRDEMTLQ